MSRRISLYNGKPTTREKMDFGKLDRVTFAGPEIYSKVVAADLTQSRFAFNRNQIRAALETQNALDLRKMSNYFYYNSGAYRRLVQYFGGILTNDFIIIPRYSESSKINEKALARQFDKVRQYAESSHIKETCSKVSELVVKDGAFFGYEREIDKVLTLQSLPPEFCRSRFTIDGCYAIEFDFAFFDKFRDLELQQMFAAFPAEFEAMYRAYQTDRQNMKWQLLNPQFARAHMLNSQIPLLAPIFLDLLELEEYKNIDKARSTLDIYKILVQKIPTNKDGEIDLYMEEIEDLHQNARSMVSNSNINVMTTPCDISEVSLMDKTAQARDDVQKATNMIYSTAGTSTALFSDGARSTSTGLKSSIQVDEALMFPLLQQFERWYENRFKLISKGKITFGISFPPISQYNKKDMMDLAIKGATLGFPTKTLTMATLGVSQFNMEYLLNYENNMLKLHEKMIPTSSAYNSKDPISSKGGRPASEEPLSDEGDKTQEGDKNDLGAE